MRLGLFLEALAKAFSTDVVVMPVSGNISPSADLPQRLGISPLVLEVESHRDTQFELLIRLKDPSARLAAFRDYGRSSLAAGVSTAILDALRERIGATQYDLVHIGRAYLADALAAVSNFRIATLDLDEDENTSRQEIAARLRSEGRLFEAEWALAEAAAEQRLISASVGSFDKFFVSSAADALSIAEIHPDLSLDVVENSVAVPENPRRQDNGSTLLFVGSFGYFPNVDAMNWFVQMVWLQVRSAVPQARLLIVGRDVPAALTSLNGRDGVEVRGPVPEIDSVYAEATLAIAPLRSGAGTRIKVIEAAAQNVPIVSTSLGARGLGLTSPDKLWLADDAGGFAAAIIEALAGPSERLARAARAREYVMAHHDRSRIAEALAARFASMLSTVGGRDQPN